MEMTRREFMQAIAGVAPAAHVSRGEGVSPLRVAGILPAMRGQDARATKDKGETPSPHCLGKYPGEVVPMGDIRKQSKWSG
jgi:hypothetical protein